MSMSLLNPQQLPFIGQGIGRIGQVYQIQANPCDIDVEIWVYAFWSGLPQLGWQLFKPEALDNVITRFGRPIGRHARRRFRAREVFSPTINPGRGLGWAAFRIVGALEKIGWYFLVWDAATQTALNWTSLAYRWAGCTTPFAPFAHARLEGLWNIAPGQENWVPMSLVNEQTFIVTVDGIYVPPGYTANFTLQVQALPPTPERPGRLTRAYLWNRNYGTIIEMGLGQNTPSGVGYTQGVHRDYWAATPDGEWEVRLECDGGICQIEGCIFRAFGAVNEPILPDP